MASRNLCLFLGNLTRDPEVKYTNKGTAIASFGLAMNRQWRNEAGEKQEEVTFVDCTAFGKTAETIGEYVKKGHLIDLQCRAKLDSWDDKQTGQKRSKISFIVESFIFMPNGTRNSEESQEQPQPRKPTQPPAQKPAPPKDPDLDIEEDDIPF